LPKSILHEIPENNQKKITSYNAFWATRKNADTCRELWRGHSVSAASRIVSTLLIFIAFPTTGIETSLDAAA
jgi:hypothetical protein